MENLTLKMFCVSPILCSAYNIISTADSGSVPNVYNILISMSTCVSESVARTQTYQICLLLHLFLIPKFTLTHTHTHLKLVDKFQHSTVIEFKLYSVQCTLCTVHILLCDKN